MFQLFVQSTSLCAINTCTAEGKYTGIIIIPVFTLGSTYIYSAKARIIPVFTLGSTRIYSAKAKIIPVFTLGRTCIYSAKASALNKQLKQKIIENNYYFRRVKRQQLT